MVGSGERESEGGRERERETERESAREEGSVRLLTLILCVRDLVCDSH